MAELTVTLGAPELELAQGARFLKAWHGERDGWTVMTRISSTGVHIVRSLAAENGKLIGALAGGGMQDLCADEGGTWNVYFSCSRHTEDPTDGGHKRGGRKTIEAMNGLWLDLDVKDESFPSGSEIDRYLEYLPLRPGFVVDSGSGGRHAYWPFAEGEVDRDTGEELNEGWWALAQEIAGSVYVDKIASADRIMRLPGTVRWPKTVEEPARLVRLLRETGETVGVERVRELVAGALERLTVRRREVTRGIEERVGTVVETLESIAELTGWERMLALANLETTFNEQHTWEEVLTPFGWTYVGDDHEGRRHWARPGQRGKSAHTDYPPSPHVMKLFSNSPETGLGSLADAGVPLTKYQVWCQLRYGGDVRAMVREMVGVGDGVGDGSDDG